MKKDKTIAAIVVAGLVLCFAVRGAGIITSAPATTVGTVAPIVSAIPVSWDSNTTVANGTIPLLLPPWSGGGKIISCSYYTGGATPSFTANLKIGGVSVTGCSAMTATSSTPTTVTATATNTFTSSSNMTLVISGVSGTPNTALVQINIQATAN